MVNKRTCIIDNGAYTAKVGLSTDDSPRVIPNCVMKAKSERRRAFIGDQLKDLKDASGLFYLLPFQKGYLVNWDIQKTVWDHIFSPDSSGSGINLSDSNVIITEPPFNFSSIQECMMEIFFEEYDVESYIRLSASKLAAIHYANERDNQVSSCIVIDMGYSFIHIIPFIKGKYIKKAIKRIEVGGKVLTNYFKEVVSYRHLNMMDESYVANQIKEDVCFVSGNLQEDMENAQKKGKDRIFTEYILPDFSNVKRGYIRKPEDVITDQQTVKFTNESFTIPEILFHPSDVGIKQMGVAPTLIESLKNCEEYTHPVLLSNIVVIGGCAMFKGMKERLYKDIRCLIPNDLPLNITIPEE